MRQVGRERIDLYAMCFNEERIVPYFLQHYSHWVDRIFILDNGSTDGSEALLAAVPSVSIRRFETTEPGFVETARRLLNGVWKESRGDADWVVIVEMDEHLYHPDLPAYLAWCRGSGVTALQTIGYNMVAEDFPAGHEPLYQQINRGVRKEDFDKLAVFRPDQISETNYAAGRHSARPTGNVVFDPEPQLRLLHFKALGVDYECSRNTVLAAGLRAQDRQRGWGTHYLRDRADVEAAHRRMSRAARRVPGLPPRHELDLTFAQEKHLILDAGLFDERFYVTNNSDVAAAAGTDPYWHFAVFGWREGRNPHRHFDLGWYRSRYGADIPHDVNPVVDYIVRGEALGRCPNPYFDPEMYRERRGLPRDVSPWKCWLASVPELSSTTQPPRKNESAEPTPRHNVLAGVRHGR